MSTEPLFIPQQMSEAEIDAFLQKHVFGHLGCYDGTFPHVYPMAYVYDGDFLYGQTTAGTKISHMRQHPNISFQVDELLGHAWSSVLLLGSFEELNYAAVSHTRMKQIVEILSQQIGTVQSTVGLDLVHSVKKSNSVGDAKEPLLFRMRILQKSGRHMSYIEPASA